jgi:hypothetical protein
MQRESGYYWVIPLWSKDKKPSIVELDSDGDYSVCGSSVYRDKNDFEFLDLPAITIIDPIENIMERWLHGRSNDDETLEAIKQELLNQGKLKFWKDEK